MFSEGGNEKEGQLSDMNTTVPILRVTVPFLELDRLGLMSLSI